MVLQMTAALRTARPGAVPALPMKWMGQARARQEQMAVKTAPVTYLQVTYLPVTYLPVSTV